VLLTRIMEIFKVIPLLSRRHRKRVTPLTTAAKNKNIAPSKTIKQEAEEYKQKLRAMRLKKEAKEPKPSKPKKLQKPLPAREHPLHKEPSRFSGVFKEWWNDRAEIIKYHYQRIKRNIIPVIFCIKVEVDD
jgi:hypothetical protein